MTEKGDLYEQTHVPNALAKLGSFEWPRSEARQTMTHLFGKIKAGMGTDKTENAVDAEQLKKVTDDEMKDEAASLLSTALHTVLDESFLEWANSENPTQRRRAFVHPPTTRSLLESWARQRGFPVLEPGDKLSDFSFPSCVVIPRLERFFSRDYAELGALFALFDDLMRFDGKVIVGCNSWAWQLLNQFDDALLLFGDAQIIPAFNADALSAILEAAFGETHKSGFVKSLSSGDPIFARDNDGALKDPYLEKLASRSLGLPWVAIEMLFKGIAETTDTEQEVYDRTIWVKIPSPCSLPVAGSDALVFGLQTLLIHGPRPSAELDSLLPQRAPNGVWAELERTGFVEIRDGLVQCSIASYPDIRSELSAAGFNMDKL